jgi:hypothetical protein
MIEQRTFLRISAISLTLLMGGCGVGVPRIEEIWDDGSPNARSLELKIKEKVYCELQTAISYINNNTPPVEVSYPDPRHPGRTITIKRKPIPETWGATLTLTLTVEEFSALNPGASLITPMIPANPRFPGDFTNPVITVPTPQSYMFGLGGTLSSDATRTDKFTSFYLIKNLQVDSPDCHDLDPANFDGSSLLLQSNLGIYNWLQNAVQIRASRGVSEKSSDEVLSYDVKFEVVSSGNVTPTWNLVRVATSSAPLFNTKRDRTHEMLISFGPAPDGQPSPLATNDALAQQIGSAVGTAVRNALSR